MTTNQAVELLSNCVIVYMYVLQQACVTREQHVLPQCASCIAAAVIRICFAQARTDPGLFIIQKVLSFLFVGCLLENLLSLGTRLRIMYNYK